MLLQVMLPSYIEQQSIGTVRTPLHNVACKTCPHCL